MKKKILYHFLAALLILCVGSLAVFWDMNKRQSIKEIGFDQLPTLEEKYFQKNIDAINKAEKTGDLEALNEAEQRVKNSLTPRLASQWQMARDRLSRISFYGKVVDQYSVPVSGAFVEVSVGGGGPWAMGKGDGQYETDGHGVFNVKGKGESITIYSIRHPNLSRFQIDTDKPGATFFPFPRNGSDGNWTHHQDEENPFIFNVWREESFGAAKLIRQGFSPKPTGEYLTYKINPDPYNDRWIKSKLQGIDPEGYVAVKCEKGSDVYDPKLPEYAQTGSWQVTFRAVKGGVQFAPENDVYLNQAPEAGYLPEITIGSKVGVEDYSKIIRNKKLYLKSQNGQVFASIFLSLIDPYFKQEYCSIRSEIKYTTDGTRNLAIKQKLKR